VSVPRRFSPSQSGALSCSPRSVSRSQAASSLSRRRLTIGGAVFLAIGFAAGAARLLASAPREAATAVGAAVLLLALVVAAGFGGWRRAAPPDLVRGRCLAIALALSPMLVAAAWAGPSISLSAVDLRFAYRLVDLPGGVVLAAVAITGALLLPPVAATLVLGPAIRRTDPTSMAPAVGLVCLGQGTAAGAALTMGTVVGTSLGIGLWLRLVVEITGIFLTAAAIPALGLHSRDLPQGSSGSG
jgi:hypothetical protein